MPVECSLEIIPVEREKFHQLDKIVMRSAFDLHNELGKLCDEQIYQSELAMRCAEASFTCNREVELRVSHGSFEKTYYMDMMVAQGVVYELKAVAALTSAHQNQLINYLLLSGIRHGKLINFRSASVESRFISTGLEPFKRKDFRLVEHQWHICNESVRLKSALVHLLEDFGTFLDIQLYREALLHLLEAPGSGYLPVPIVRSIATVGFQKMCLLDSDQAWHLSSLKTGLGMHETHIRRLMHRTPLEFIHWINFNKDQITLKSLKK